MASGLVSDAIITDNSHFRTAAARMQTPIFDLRRVSKGAAFVFVAFLVLQTVVVILHEHVHSTVAWLLGYTPTPFTVVWGNPITVTGWTKASPTPVCFRTLGTRPKPRSVARPY